MKIIVFCIAFLAMMAAEAQVGQGALKAMVTDRSTGEALPFVNVALMTEGKVATGGQTDMNGHVYIKPVVPGTYTVEMRSLGYEKLVFEGVIICAEKDTRLMQNQCRMNTEHCTLREVIIVGDGAHIAETACGLTCQKPTCGYQSYPITTRDVDSNTVGTGPVPGEKPSWTLYPNPARSTVQLERDRPIGELVIFDMKGTMVLALNSDQNSQVIDMQHFRPGVYFIRFREGNDWVNTRVLKVD